MELNEHNISEEKLEAVSGGKASGYDCPEPDPEIFPCEKYICSKCGNKFGAHRMSCPVGKTDKERCGTCRLLLKDGTVCSRNVLMQRNG